MTISDKELEEIGYIDNPQEIIVEYNQEQWQAELIEKYEKLFNIVRENLPNLWDSLEFEISVQKILNIKDCTLPFAGIVLGRPSSMKTVGISMFRTWKNSFYSDKFTAKAFVSHSTAVKNKKELEDIDLLPKIKNKLFLTPELASTFTKNDDEINEILGIFTRVLDGEGFESDSGVHGHRAYHGEYMFTWIGAAVDIPRKVHKLMGNLGAKLYFLRLPGIDKDEDEYLEDLENDDFRQKTKLIQDSLIDYLETFEKYPGATLRNNIAKVPWNFEQDDKECKRFIVRLGRLLAHLRGVVPTWHSEDTQGIDYAHTFATVEDPSRAIRQLTNLARGHALSEGRNYIITDDIPLIIKVVLSTASTERSRLFETILNFGGALTTRQIVDYLNVASPTAKRTMLELKAIGLVNLETIPTQHGEPTYQITLDDKFEWFLSQEFKDLRYRKKITPHTHENRSTDDVYGGAFSYGIPSVVYQEQVMLNSVIPRSQ